MLKDAITYEIMTPQSVGRAESKLVLGKHSGRHALRVELAKIGYAVGTYDLLEAFGGSRAWPITRRRSSRTTSTAS